jgi:hypothetical protein
MLHLRCSILQLSIQGYLFLSSVDYFVFPYFRYLCPEVYLATLKFYILEIHFLFLGCLSYQAIQLDSKEDA